MDTCYITPEEDYLLFFNKTVIECDKNVKIWKGSELHFESDGGFCPCCTSIDKSGDGGIHHYFVKEMQNIHKPIPFKVNGISLDKNPCEWFDALKKDPQYSHLFSPNKEIAKKIVGIILAIKDSIRKPTLAAKALCSIYRRDWKCELIQPEDKKILNASE